jgi:hypothetical protein
MNTQGVSDMQNFKNSASMSMKMQTPSFPTVQHFTPNAAFNRSSVKMSASSTTAAREIDDEYFLENERIDVSRN